MRVALLNDREADMFSKQLLDIVDGKFPTAVTSGLILFLAKFCHFTESNADLIKKVIY